MSSIGPVYRPLATTTRTSDVALDSEHLAKTTSNVAAQLMQVVQDPSLSNDPSYLKKIANAVSQLNKTVEDVRTRVR